MSHLFLDANILMEIVFQRVKSGSCLRTIKNYKNLYISSLSVHICMYYLEKDLVISIREFVEIISGMTILDLNSETIFAAFNVYDLSDFEDCIQVATCLEPNITNFLTLDKQLAKKHGDKLNIILL